MAPRIARIRAELPRIPVDNAEIGFRMLNLPWTSDIWKRGEPLACPTGQGDTQVAEHGRGDP